MAHFQIKEGAILGICMPGCRNIPRAACASDFPSEFLPMKLTFFSLGLLVLSGMASLAADPLRVFIRGGVKSHAPGAHEHARFLKDWQPSTICGKEKGNLQRPSCGLMGIFLDPKK
jgi:hypothetical protein